MTFTTAEEAATRHRALEALLDDGYIISLAVRRAGYKNIGSARNSAAVAGRTDLLEKMRGPTRAQKTQARIEDYEFLVRNGEWPPRAVQRAGFDNLAAARSTFQGHNRIDLSETLSGYLHESDTA